MILSFLRKSKLLPARYNSLDEVCFPCFYYHRAHVSCYLYCRRRRVSSGGTRNPLWLVYHLSSRSITHYLACPSAFHEVDAYQLGCLRSGEARTTSPSAFGV